MTKRLLCFPNSGLMSVGPDQLAVVCRNRCEGWHCHFLVDCSLRAHPADCQSMDFVNT